MWQFDGLFELINTSPIITIFRHVHPDCDAVGSQFGLINWIQENWPDKKVYALGLEYCQQGNCWPQSDSVKKEDLQNSLAFVLDTATQERIDDSSYRQAKAIVKIDHHPDLHPFGDHQYIFTDSASTCEILTTFFRQHPEQAISQKTAEYLYRGILTDTLSFHTSNTTGHSLETAGWLSQFDVRIPELYRELFDQSLEDFKFANMIRNSVQIREGRLAYRIVSMKEMNEWAMQAKDVKNFIEEFSSVREFEIYTIFIEKLENGKTVYDGSLRSKHVTINDIAEEFHGGGHANACGVKGLSMAKVDALLDALYERISQ